MIPVSDGGDHLFAKVAQDGVERFTALRAGLGKRVHELAGLSGGDDGIITGVREVLGDPIYRFVSGALEVGDVVGPEVGIGNRTMNGRLRHRNIVKARPAACANRGRWISLRDSPGER